MRLDLRCGPNGDVERLEPMIAPPAIVVVGAASALREDLDWYVGTLRENGLG